MSPRPRVGSREELAALCVAIAFVSSGVWFWLRNNTSSQEPRRAPAPPSLESPIPRDTFVYSGTLRNGIRYYVRANDAPEHRAELRLVVNAGSVLEDDDQRGLAHGVEHMLFRGTEHFPGHKIDEYMQSIGMRPGRDVNAATSMDETIYRFTVPTDRDGVLDTAIAILADMAHKAKFDPAEAREEAGVLLEEWRSGADARERIADKRNQLLLAGSRYAERRTIGDTAVLRKFSVPAMRRFYENWYRPDLMSIVIVGDLAPVATQVLVRKHFGSIPKAENPRPRAPIPVALARSPSAAVFTDPEVDGTRVAVWYPRQAQPRRLMGDFRASLVRRLLRDALNARLEDLADQPGAPVLDAGISWHNHVRPVDIEVLGGSVMNDQSLPALEALIGEVAQLERHGVSPRELERLRAAVLRERREAVEWQDRSTDLADAYADEFLTGGTALTREIAYSLTRDLLPTITVADLRRAARAWSLSEGAAFFVTAGSDRTASRIDPAALIARARETSLAVVEARSDSADKVVLMPALPAPGKIASERYLKEGAVFEWVLSNGMRALLKPTRFTSDDIEFRLSAPGGASLASDADYPSAYLSDGVLRSTGVGAINATQLGRYLESTSIDLSPTVSDDAVWLTGSAAPRDLERLFQLAHLYLTAPRADTVGFRRYRDRVAHSSRSHDADPEAVFSDSVAATMSGHHARALSASRKFSEAVDLKTALDFWKQRTANASNFTLVMTGDFTVQRVRPLIERYLASLPAGVRETPRDVGIRRPTGVIRRRVTLGIGPKAKTQIVLSGPYDPTGDADRMLSAVSDLAELTLGNVLREKLGGTYGVSVSVDRTLTPPSSYRMIFAFDAAPERIDSLSSVALQEIERLKTSGPTRQQFETIRTAELRDLDGRLEENGYWARELETHTRLGMPLAGIQQHRTELELLSITALRDACAKYLSTGEFVQVTMMPKGR